MVKKANQENIKFEDALSRLEEIIVKLQDGELSLDESLNFFQEGVQLVRICQSKLDAAETKINMLIKDNDGSLIEVPFIEESGK